MSRREHQMNCSGATAADFASPCVRDLWAAVPPAAIVLLLLVAAIPIPTFLKNAARTVARPFRLAVTQEEAELVYASQALLPKASDVEQIEAAVLLENARSIPVSKTRTGVFLAGTSLLALGWLAVGVDAAVHLGRSSENLIPAIPAFLLFATWAYSTIHIATRPLVVVSYPLLLLFSLSFFGAILQLGGDLYDHGVLGKALPPRETLAFEIANLALTGIVVFLMQNMPIHVSSIVDPSISPEDQTTIWRWWTWIWVYPLIALGNSKTVSEEEVWNLSPTLRTKVATFIFDRNPGRTLTRRILKSNSLDITLTVVIAYAGGLLDFAEPYFIKQILSGFERGDSRGHLLLLAFLFLVCYIFRGQSEVQSLWYARRAATRIQLQLSASVYQKALQMRDQKGMVSSESKKESSKTDSKDGKKAADTKDKKAGEKKDASTSADVGKIVNLLGIDIGRITNLAINGSFLWVAPMQFIMSCFYLYALLGLPAFAGLIPMILLFPVSRKVANNVTKVQRGIMGAKDKRMKIVNELFGSIKFVKWFAWENQWIERVMASRANEIIWLKKARNNGAALNAITGFVPLSVSVVSFWVYVALGNRLDIATAFAALRLFDMLRLPMQVLPYALVTLSSVKVALERLGNFFDEDVVPEDVSSFDVNTGHDAATTLSIENATFRWFQLKSADSVSKVVGGSPLPNVVSETTTAGLQTPSTSTTGTIVAEDASVPPSATAIDEDEARVFELRDISISFPDGQLTVVTGPTASGKTALLMALLGEMELLPGGKRTLPKNTISVDSNGLTNSIAYCAQMPWLQQMSIKDNIIFDSEFHEERYQATLKACALLPDLARFEDGDRTEIGAKGVSLSGGQKARVALARAVYSRAKYVLLDDPLSAVDSHTARFLYEELLLGPLMEHRTVILVTHHVDLVLSGAGYLITMLEGRIELQGTFSDLREQGLLESVRASVETFAPGEEDTEEAEAVIEETDVAKPVVELKKARKFVEEEKRGQGRVKWPIYKTYLKATGYWSWIIVLLGIVVGQFFNVGQKVWLAIWGDAYDDVHTSILSISVAPQYAVSDLPVSQHFFHFTAQNLSTFARPSYLPSAEQHPLFYVEIYAAIGLISLLVTSVVRFLLVTRGIAGSNILFKAMLENVTRATMRWYDTTPVGRILNRLGKDTDTMDMQINFAMFMTMNRIADTLASLLTIIIIIPSFLPGTVVLTAMYLWCTARYINTMRDLKRMEATTRSPILTSFTDLVEGVVTVRAFAASRSFLRGHFDRVDKNAKFIYFMFMMNRWFSWACDVLSSLSVFFSIVFVILAFPTSPGIGGLVISSAMQFGRSIYMTCRSWTELELALNSVERVVEYVKDLPQEPPAVIESNRPPAYWPSSTASDSLLVVDNLDVKYAPELPSVLEGVSFSLKAQERVGLLGRTGSGKSTLAMSLLRFVDPVKGSIIIDGIDISKIGVHDLRSRLTFIPQDATLFAGTIRSNLDPFEEHSDAECLDVLRRVNMITDSTAPTPAGSHLPSKAPSIIGHEVDASASTAVAPSLAPSDSLTQVDRESGPVKITLDSAVSAGGGNFSSGQRQLLALARALLRRSTVVIMDEATSQIDMETDERIQATIREEFKESLLITVAHRLRTIIDYDRLIVLENGKIAEVGTPGELITREGGIFRMMCQKSGMFEELEARVKF